MGYSASLPVTTLTPFHALKEASLQINEYLLVFGASGNTGMMAIQFGKKMGPTTSWQTEADGILHIQEWRFVNQNLTLSASTDIPISYFPVGTGDFLNENSVLAKILKIFSPILVFLSCYKMSSIHSLQNLDPLCKLDKRYSNKTIDTLCT